MRMAAARMTDALDDKRDFFISYNNADQPWAEWIAYILEAEGHSCVIQVWDFRPGANFVLEMQKAAEKAERTIAVLSPAYLGASFPAPEWAAAFANDPQGLQRKLVPVRVEACEPTGLLKALIYIDLIGLDEAAATTSLLRGVEPGRVKPAAAPVFPNTNRTAPTQRPKFPGIVQSMKAGVIAGGTTTLLSRDSPEQSPPKPKLKNHPKLKIPESSECTLLEQGSTGKPAVFDKLEELAMLQNEYANFAKSVDYVSSDQAQQIIGVVLDRLKEDVGAIIVDLWICIPNRHGLDILRPYLRRSDPLATPPPKDITLDKNAIGLLAWVSETQRPVWLADINPEDKSGTNRLTGEIIAGRFFNVYPGTRAFAAIPIEYRNQLRAILSVEVAVSNRLQIHHLHTMRTLSEPTGIIVWKAGFFEENRNHTNQAIQDFHASTILSPFLNPYRTAFIARPPEDFFNVVGKAVEKILENERIRATAYLNVPGGTLIEAEMLSAIGSAHFGIADITNSNKNVLVEIGAMIALRKPFILLRSKDDDTSLPLNIDNNYCLLYETKSAQTIIYDHLSVRPLQEFIRLFIVERMLRSKAFREAAEWFRP